MTDEINPNIISAEAPALPKTPTTGSNEQSTDYQNNEPQGIERINKEAFRTMATSTVTFSITSAAIMHENRSHINLRIFLLPSKFSNRLYAFYDT